MAGGTYYRTYDPVVDGGVTLAADGGPADEADPATVSGSRLDKYLVTVGRFRQFVSAVMPSDGGTGWLPAASSGKHAHLNGGNGLSATGGGYEPGWATSDNGNIAPTNGNLACDGSATWTISPGGNENKPISCVNWYEAYAFCIWDGGFLPSESEWEYAAAGGSQQREYPWGMTAPGTGNQYAIYGNNAGTCYYPSSGGCTGVFNIAPVGTATLGAGQWGQLDLAGNVYEWNLDWSATYVDPCIDCAYLAASSNRVARGGYYYQPASDLLPSFRDNAPPSYRAGGFGFRCAKTP